MTECLIIAATINNSSSLSAVFIKLNSMPTYIFPSQHNLYVISDSSGRRQRKIYVILVYFSSSLICFKLSPFKEV